MTIPVLGQIPLSAIPVIIAIAIGSWLLFIGLGYGIYLGYDYITAPEPLPTTPEVKPTVFIYEGERFGIPLDWDYDLNGPYTEQDFRSDEMEKHWSGEPSYFDNKPYSQWPVIPVKDPPEEPIEDYNSDGTIVDVTIPSPTGEPTLPPTPNVSTPDPTYVDPTDIPDGKDSDNVFDPDHIPTDPDPDAKGGGKDPIVLKEGFNYFDFNAYKCSNAVNSFDFDIDTFPEHMCYWYTPTTKIFFNDKYNNQTLIDGSQFIGDFTHLWQDKNSNIFIDDGELTEIDEHGIQIFAKNKDGWVDYDSGRYVYCSGGSNFGNVFCTYPTYWQTQEWMK